MLFIYWNVDFGERAIFKRQSRYCARRFVGSPSSGRHVIHWASASCDKLAIEDALIELSIALKLGEASDDTLENLGEVNAPSSSRQDSIGICLRKSYPRLHPKRRVAAEPSVAVLESAGESNEPQIHLYVTGLPRRGEEP